MEYVCRIFKSTKQTNKSGKIIGLDPPLGNFQLQKHDLCRTHHPVGAGEVKHAIRTIGNMTLQHVGIKMSSFSLPIRAGTLRA
ncbi:MAG: hypothetical protein A2785_04175 [Candidatus Chisholmbacteria bacterium RIFCSPHIGHO2_01_FULL_49_18]|uniref:Uncharacterized protein n=2 Tax=Candidatus Chisholmiibacteriota TaxID=1817900 RepID=A0A1G1VP74_9BACT|nr:MAG: hypothetical protein A2785_04175 [Candidatus Chisholmbacteria bacterium RIFCSPHIGHO2_01_FULL_49_18]OGY22521.1 MAG: hypothetical protein A3A65_00840 [Candidatus Chisholmbacteria bacterium RIFCSPLOWO2_01_FULL_49_14]